MIQNKKSNYKIFTPYILLIPSLVFSVGILFYPTIKMVQYSFLNWTFGKAYETAEWNGINNYIWIFNSPSSSLYHALYLTITYTVLSVIAELVIGLIVAVILNRNNVLGRSTLLTGFMIPTLLMPVMVGMMWRMYMYPNGILSYFLRLFGMNINWYTADWALPAVILIEIWQFTPFFIISFVAGLRAIPTEVIDASVVDGASGWSQFINISLPYLKPIIVVTVMIRSLWIIKSFDVIYTMFTGGPGSATEILGLSIYRALFMYRNIGRSASLSVILAILSLIVTYMFLKFIYRSRESSERSNSN